MGQCQQKKRLISFDLDMTLLDHKSWKIPDSAMEAIRRLREDSVIVVASGRDMNAAYSIPYRDMVQPDAIIHLNGTQVEAEGEILYEHLMDKGRLERLLRYGIEQHIAIGLSADGLDYYTDPEKVQEYDIKHWRVTDRKFQDPWKLMDMPVRTLVCCGGREHIEELERQFPEFKFPMFFGERGADIVEQEASKANGLRRLCSYYGIPLLRTVAFGDSMNDLEIIQEAGIGIAMGNAVEPLKQAADYVTTDIDQDGVWNACLHLGLLE